MRTLLLIGVGLFYLTFSFAQQSITLDNIWKDYTFSPKGIPGFNFQNDGVHYTRLIGGQKIVQYDLRTGLETATLLDVAQLSGISRLSSYSFSDDEQWFVLAVDEEGIYRHSSKAFYYLYNRASKALMPVADQKEKIRLATLNPQGTQVAYVFDNNLYVKELASGNTRQITTDGAVNAIINGATDWVYEEEFGEHRGFYWAPDGKQLAYFRFDEQAVPQFTMTNYYDQTYPDYQTFKYPKVGEANSKVSLHIYDWAANKSIQVVQTNDDWEYLPRMVWTQNAGELCATLMNRHQNLLELRLLSFNGSSRTLLREENPYYIDIHDNLFFLKNGKQFIWTSEQDGWNHIYLYNMQGKLERQLTKGNWEVTGFYGLDEEHQTLYYQAAKKDPLNREVYSQTLDKAMVTPLAQQPGTNSARFSTTFDYFVLTHSSANQPPSYMVLDKKGQTLRTIEDNAGLATLQKEYGASEQTFFTIKTPDELALNAWMIKPANFDENQTYPVLMYVYGGPGSQTVNNAWGGANYWWFQMLAQQGFIVVSVDNRGTGARGQEFKKATYLQLGHYEVQDQISAARYLGSLPYVDASRIGIFGWSYGGYMSSLCLLKGHDVFNAAIAVAPVTNWKWYDNIYTERYMRTVAENEKGYKDNSPVYFADKLQGDYLLIHGMGDDNVHFQNTAEMANALIAANKQFDTYFYPNRNHGIYGGNTRLHLYTKMTNFLLAKLRDDGPVTGKKKTSGPIIIEEPSDH